MNNRDKFLFVFIALLIVVILLFIFYKTEKEFDLQDRCGPIVNLISHTIASEGGCQTRCKQQCDTAEMSYSRINFINAGVGCNTCTCYCKEGLLK